ncbi:MAG: hypothetical protein ACJA2G_001800 [Cognaticolwellia sp.]|jgi:hypothetical protein
MHKKVSFSVTWASANTEVFDAIYDLSFEALDEKMLNTG